MRIERRIGDWHDLRAGDGDLNGHLYGDGTKPMSRHEANGSGPQLISFSYLNEK